MRAERMGEEGGERWRRGGGYVDLLEELFWLGADDVRAPSRQSAEPDGVV